MTDDITFCGNECDNTKCRRHRSNIKEPQYPHSVALLEGTEYCEKKPTPEHKSVRLIDAEALKKAIEKQHQSDKEIAPLVESISYYKLNNLINNAPTIITGEQVDLNEVKAIAEKAEQERPQGDLISRSALLKELDEYNEFAVFDCEAIKDLINDVPTISIDWGIDGGDKTVYARPQGEWIPVSERLPEYSGLYLISVDDVVTVANFTGTYFIHRGGGRVEVYAWQPLPEPYKKGGAENEC